MDIPARSGRTLHGLPSLTPELPHTSLKIISGLQYLGTTRRSSIRFHLIFRTATNWKLSTRLARFAAPLTPATGRLRARWRQYATGVECAPSLKGSLPFKLRKNFTTP